MLGSSFRVTVDHGRVIEPDGSSGPPRLATLHPSAILRARTQADRAEGRRTLVTDLAAAAEALQD